MTARKQKEEAPQPLTGKALLEALPLLKECSRPEAAVACGYWRFAIDKKGKSYKQGRVDRFNKALLLASTGIDFAKNKGSKRGRPKEPRGFLKITATHGVILGKSYTRKLNWNPGEYCNVAIDLEKEQIIVTKALKE
jgi:hypothetical protein